MYDIQTGQGCGIRATLLTPAGSLCDLRRARHIAATLVLPSGATMNCEDVAFDFVTNAVYVRLLGARELTASGRYGIVFNVNLSDRSMYSTPVVWFAEVKDDAPTGYRELTLSLSLTVVDFPDNVSYTGASPKIGDKNTWLVYDDKLQAYIDTGVIANNLGLSEAVPVVQQPGDYPDLVMSQAAVTEALRGKVDAVAGKGLSTFDFTEAHKTKLDRLPAPELLPVAAESTLVASAGRFYYRYGQAALSVTGVTGFSSETDCAALAVSGNCTVTFGAVFKCQQGIDTLEATAAQYKIYTIQWVPLSATEAIHIVNCSVYG
ncbi:hypothetical protein [Alistipes sp.]|uniref:hypothetical protein n=1 Tax=Alistipes sp. TaxID=1872444 RepID=UPI003AF185D0